MVVLLVVLLSTLLSAGSSEPLSKPFESRLHKSPVRSNGQLSCKITNPAQFRLSSLSTLWKHRVRHRGLAHSRNMSELLYKISVVDVWSDAFNDLVII